MLEQEEHKLESLRNALIAGERSGESVPLDSEAIRLAAKKKAGIAS